jgi:hypothetical protein
MGISKAILAQASLVYNSVHIAIDHRLAIIDPPAIDHIVLIVDTMALSRLSAPDHNKVLSLGLDFQKREWGYEECLDTRQTLGGLRKVHRAYASAAA